MTAHLTLTVADSPDVLVRVLTLLRRRGCVVRSVEFSTGDRHRPSRLDIGYVPPSRCAGAVPAWLENLVDVIAVR